jgi:hypothetical protein
MSKPKPSTRRRGGRIKLYVRLFDWAHEPLESVREFVVMPRGGIVVRMLGGESLWFNSRGKHPKSELLIQGKKGLRRCRAKDLACHSEIETLKKRLEDLLGAIADGLCAQPSLIYLGNTQVPPANRGKDRYFTDSEIHALVAQIAKESVTLPFKDAQGISAGSAAEIIG